MNTLSYERSSLGRWAGTVLQDTYRLGRQIGRGETGEVYEAGHTRLPGLFAVKILHPELAANREAFELFCLEADVLSSLRHPHAVQIFDFSMTPDGLPYIVTECLEGTALGARLAQGGPLAPPAAARMVEAVASALDAAHARGIVHGHLHPGKILLAGADSQEVDAAFVKVLDFGASRVPRASRPGGGGRGVGGVKLIPASRYLAPEQLLDLPDSPDARTDQFALGALAYAMLTGRDAFAGDDVATLVYRIIHQNPPPLARFLPGDVSPLQEVIDRALAKERADRFDTAGELGRALAAAVHDGVHREPAAEAAVATAAAVAPAAAVAAVAPVAPVVTAAPVVTIEIDRPAPARSGPVTRYRAAVLGAAMCALLGVALAARYLHVARFPSLHQLAAATLPDATARAEAPSAAPAAPLTPAAPAPPSPPVTAPAAAPLSAASDPAAPAAEEADEAEETAPPFSAASAPPLVVDPPAPPPLPALHGFEIVVPAGDVPATIPAVAH